MKPKVFKDPVHGYISVEEDIVDLIIDSRYFQRLRRIEQTSMRCVYPSARHDRFAHSLGTYYLAKVATDAVKKTAMGSSGGTISPSIQTLTFNFEMAALLHDIGHSPMSHTLEKFFEDSEPILKILIGRINDQAFKDDLITASPSPHEIVSCIIVWDC
ncbi:MAG: HD domain-containing protein, partial [Clostridiales bacterium]|nr:HD domain-containing protein [Clostridiales bacterium]